MSSICEKNLARLKAGNIWDKPSRFCLAQVAVYESDKEEAMQKVDDLLKSADEVRSRTRLERACSIGGCTLKIVQDVELGRVVTGECRASDYCLKEKFEEVGTAENSSELYRDIIDSLEGHADKYSAGNFCPRLDCGLSAGVSIDMIPGTAGECVVEIRSPQQQLPVWD